MSLWMYRVQYIEMPTLIYNFTGFTTMQCILVGKCHNSKRESWFWSPLIFACGIRKCLFGKSGIQLKESGILLTIRIQNPSLTCRKFWYPVIGIWNPLHGIQKSKTVSNSPTWGDKYITVSCWNYHHWLLVSKFQCQWHIPTQSTPSLPSLKVLSKEGWFHIRVVFMCIRERPLVVCIKVAHSDAFAPDINWGPESLSKGFWAPNINRMCKGLFP